jgi:hypothetical protein
VRAVNVTDTDGTLQKECAASNAPKVCPEAMATGQLLGSKLTVEEDRVKMTWR